MQDLRFIKPTWQAPSSVKALISTRHGGVSLAPYNGLNVGMHVGDDSDAVLANRQILLRQANLPSEPIWLNQTHGTEIANLDVGLPNPKAPCDGAVTTTKGIVCAIMTADCLPLFVCNLAGNQIALLHVGWRGLADGIIEQGINHFSDSADNLIAWAGPCISVENFEVGLEVRRQLGGSDGAYRPSVDQTKCYADLYQLTKERLADAGVGQYQHSEHCTYRDQADYFSHRRDQRTGRMVSLLWLE